MEFSKANDWDKEHAKNILREIVSGSWFWQTTKQLLSIRNGKVPKNDLINKLGIDSGADPKKHLPSLNVLLEYLKYVELINEENGIITYGKFGVEKVISPQIKPKEGIEIVQIRFGDELFAVDIKELGTFLREKGKKIDSNIYKVK